QLAHGVGVEPRRWLAVGDGAILFAEQLRRAGVEVAAHGSPLNRIAARAVCELGARLREPGEAPQDPLPLYGRRPDAELTRERRLAATGGREGASR
ncbi:MAG: hypothetical protein ACYCX7_00005, partial [Solirubrobacteraceae bacterium]